MSLVVGGQHAVSINNIVSEINEKKKKDAYMGVQPGCDGDDDVWPLVVAIVIILVSYSK